MVAAAGAAVVLLVFQALLGGITVVNELPPNIVTAHLAIALVLLALLLLITTLSLMGPQPAETAPTAVPWLPVVAALAVYGVMMLGSYMVGKGASLACTGFPLCNGEVIPGGNERVMIHFAHRLAAAGAGALIAALAVQAWRRQAGVRPLVVTATLALATYTAQALLGASNIWFQLAPGVRAAHLGMGTALWMTLVVHVILAYRLAQPMGMRAAPRRGAPVPTRPLVAESRRPSTEGSRSG
jgi:heme A synthase